MGIFFKMLPATAIIFQLLTGTAAAWEEETKTNQDRAHAYILQLKSGENPDSIERPVLKRARTLQAKQIRRQLIEEMDKAERYARNGQHERIEKPTEKKSIVRPKPVRKY